MSRVGKKPILIPAGVEVKIEDQRIMVKGPKGELDLNLRPEIKAEAKEGKIFVLPRREVKEIKALWGVQRQLINNLVQGVSQGFEKKLEIQGIGYRANLDGQDLVLYVGFSHPVKITAPPGIKFSVEKNIIAVSGIDKQLVGELAAKIRRIKKPEPYKGKGIMYLGERIRRKAGKKAATVK